MQTQDGISMFAARGYRASAAQAATGFWIVLESLLIWSAWSWRSRRTGRCCCCTPGSYSLTPVAVTW